MKHERLEKPNPKIVEYQTGVKLSMFWPYSSYRQSSRAQNSTPYKMLHAKTSLATKTHEVWVCPLPPKAIEAAATVKIN